MSEAEADGESSDGSDYKVNNDYQDGIRDLMTPATSLNTTKHSTQKLVILYVIGIFLAVVLCVAMSYILKLSYRSLLPKRKPFCDFRDCFRQSSGKKRKIFQRHAHKTNFNIPVVVISDENGQYLDPEGFAEEFETKDGQTFP